MTEKRNQEFKKAVDLLQPWGVCCEASYRQRPFLKNQTSDDHNEYAASWDQFYSLAETTIIMVLSEGLSYNYTMRFIGCDSTQTR